MKEKIGHNMAASCMAWFGRNRKFQEINYVTYSHILTKSLPILTGKKSLHIQFNFLEYLNFLEIEKKNSIKQLKHIWVSTRSIFYQINSSHLIAN